MTNLDYSAASLAPDQSLKIPCKIDQKYRWRPSEQETKALKACFEQNPYPNPEEKKHIVHDLRLNFNSKVEINQLNRWFQNQRERTLNPYVESLGKNIYRKFSQEQLDVLQKSFSKNSYPKLREMTTLAEQLDVSLSKIENWFKHNRRSLVKQGCFTLKVKKYFTQDELAYLDGEFGKESHPTRRRIIEIADKLGCHALQIKNWFTNKRKKIRFLSAKLLPGSTNIHDIHEKIEEGQDAVFDGSSKTTLASDTKLNLNQPPHSFGSFSQIESFKDSPTSASNVEFCLPKISSQNMDSPYFLDKTLLVPTSSTAMPPVMLSLTSTAAAAGTGYKPQLQPFTRVLAVAPEDIIPGFPQLDMLSYPLHSLPSAGYGINRHSPVDMMRNELLGAGRLSSSQLFMNPRYLLDSLNSRGIPSNNHIHHTGYLQNSLKASLSNPLGALSLVNPLKKVFLSLNPDQIHCSRSSYPLSYELEPNEFIMKVHTIGYR